MMKKIILVCVSLIIGQCFALTRRERDTLSTIAERHHIPLSRLTLTSDTILVPYYNDFEDDASDWAVVVQSPLCQWNIVFHPEWINISPLIFPIAVDLPEEVIDHLTVAYLPSAHSGSKCFWYGNPANGTFIGEPFLTPSPDDGGISNMAHSGLLVSPIFISDPLIEELILSFWTWWEVECIDIDQFDSMVVMVTVDEGTTWDMLVVLNPPFSRLVDWDHWESYSSGGYLQYGIWTRWFVDLSSYIGVPFRIGFWFDTRDALYNGFRGWFIDDVAITPSRYPDLHNSWFGPDSLRLVNCHPEPDTFTAMMIVQDIGELTVGGVMALITAEPSLTILSEDSFWLGDIVAHEAETLQVLVAIDTFFDVDTQYCISAHITSSDTPVSYRDDFDTLPRLFTGTPHFDYTSASLPFGPTSAVSGDGIAGVPPSSPTYSAVYEAYFESIPLDLTGWSACFLSFWYWMDVPEPIDMDGVLGIDGGIVEYSIDGGVTWNYLDPYGVGILLPRYDLYISSDYGNPLAGKMGYCRATRGWVHVLSQNLFSMGILAPGDIVKFRFHFAKSLTDGVSDRAGWFIDDFMVSSLAKPVGPYDVKYCIRVPAPTQPVPHFYIPRPGTYSACDTQQIIVLFETEAGVVPESVSLLVNDVEFRYGSPQLYVDQLGLIYSPSPLFTTDQLVNVELNSIFDYNGCSASILECSFWVDLSPPLVALLSPLSGAGITGTEPAVFLIYDTLSGLDPTSIWVTNGPFSGDTTSPAVELRSDTLIFYPSLAGTNWFFYPQICIRSHDTPDYCAPNETTYCFVIASAPTAVAVFPPNNAVVSCHNQEVHFVIRDHYGIVDSTASVLLNGQAAQWEMMFRDETLLVVRPDGFDFQHGQVVNVTLTDVVNIYGVHLAEPAGVRFVVDLMPPVLPSGMNLPEGFTPDAEQDISFIVLDMPAGVCPESLALCFDDDDDTCWYGTTVGWAPNDSGGMINFIPENHGISFTPGDTIVVSIRLCDRATICGSNCATYMDTLLIEPPPKCAISPNPFSPNGDGVNDITRFFFPKMFVYGGEIRIYDLKGVLVKTISVQPGQIPEWSGCDDAGRMLVPGLYIYVVIQHGRAVCNGTVLLAR